MITPCGGGCKVGRRAASCVDRPKGRWGSSLGAVPEKRTGGSPSNTCWRQWASPGRAAGRDDLMPSRLSD